MPNKCQKRSQTGIMMFSIGLHAQLFAVYCLCIPGKRNFRQAETKPGIRLYYNSFLGVDRAEPT